MTIKEWDDKDSTKGHEECYRRNTTTRAVFCIMRDKPQPLHNGEGRLKVMLDFGTGEESME